MNVSDEEKRIFISYINELLNTEQVKEMQNYIQHGKTSTFTHCLVVSYYCYLAAIRLPFQFDIKSVTRGAMLHDFYLYDWHIPEKSHKLHGFVHPGIALQNARKHFTLNPIEEDIIEKHMWPLTVHKLPVYKEATLVLMIDKYVSLAETLHIPVIPKDYKKLLRELSYCKPAY
ncbi:MAG TPA: HD family phosphohydrolase [Mobilitalea sp.]|nr:HD family phosphohydrolase [Mobilitalea sp.]